LYRHFPIELSRFPEDEHHRKRWLEAIGKTDAEVPVQSILCSRHFSRDCFVDTILMDDAVPLLESKSVQCFAAITETSEKKEKKKEAEEEEKGSGIESLQCTPSVMRPTIRK